MERVQIPEPIDGVEILFGPEDFAPSRPEMEVVGAFNPGVKTIEEGGLEKTLLMIRVTETPHICPKGEILLPYFDVKNRDDSEFRIEFDEEDENSLEEIGKREVQLRKDGTFRLRHISYQMIAVLGKDGTTIERIETKSRFYPCWEHERFGIEDIRIAKIGEGYLLTYVSPHRTEGVSTSFAITRDFKTYKRLPINNTPRPIFVGEKDVIPLEGKFPSTHARDELGNPRMDYAALTRPNAFYQVCKPATRMSYSQDLIDWGNPHHLLDVRGDDEANGPGPTPIKVDDMWLGVYHEVDKNNVYRGALFGLDLREPWRLLHRSKPFIFPNEHDRGDGYVPDVSYPSGLILRDGIAYIYTGENDSFTSVRKYYLEDLVKFLKA